jgi:hypothetical protein
MTTQTNYDRVLAQLDDVRWQQMLVIADAAEEAGDAVSAAGWRWMAEHRRWPVEARGVHRWYRGLEDDRQAAYLPEEVFDRLPGEAGVGEGYRARRWTVGQELREYQDPWKYLPDRTQRKRDPGNLPADSRLLAVVARAVGEWLTGGGDG